ncbi:flagellar hook-basal body complex protein FliE [Desulfopila aestuarii]|uniref:Flagellar hook-basal body complex protein FliE n=1 Tax=Desulfopila aestuarii DSM 18488 TaxID=1121416 RepID=A0A1M7YDJ8_9BACT|nr:flagellar hook-basal body complex protein FliE [Desulfopila aestuarii]SHO50705.1 flagellar hook-basal body complex protein FliE [Desulfopila aestuarii DSM 18488]
MNNTILISPANPLPLRQPDTSSVSKAKEGFGELLTKTINEVNQQQVAGDVASDKVQTGDAKHLHEAMIAIEEADISLRMLVQMRNKVQQAYEEIMRLQI